MLSAGTNRPALRQNLPACARRDAGCRSNRSSLAITSDGPEMVLRIAAPPTNSPVRLFAPMPERSELSILSAWVSIA
jgi:hypothetical protein